MIENTDHDSDNYCFYIKKIQMEMVILEMTILMEMVFLISLDIDDDNDGVLTKDEGGADGDPTNDFNDPNNPTLPDYLNPDVTSN